TGFAPFIGNAVFEDQVPTINADVNAVAKECGNPMARNYPLWAIWLFPRFVFLGVGFAQQWTLRYRLGSCHRSLNLPWLLGLVVRANGRQVRSLHIIAQIVQGRK